MKLLNLVKEVNDTRKELRTLTREIVMNLGDDKLVGCAIEQRNAAQDKLAQLERKVSQLCNEDFESYFLYLLATYQ